MKDGFLTDHERLAQHAGDFGGLAERAMAIAGELSRTLDELGTPWGTDDVGQSFSAVYSGPSLETRKNIDAASGRLGDMGDRLTTMAAAYRDADAGASRKLGAI